MIPLVRLHKVIASTGIASRREAELWIVEGKVRVNDKVVTQAGLKVDPSSDRIEVNGKLLPEVKKFYYYVFHKPRNVLVARSDPRGRPLIYQYLTRLPTLLHPVGRLDFDSEGLLLLTNDGSTAHALTHPSSRVEKTYHVKVAGELRSTMLRKLQRGVKLEDGPARVKRVKVIKKNPKSSWLEIVVTEGRNRLIRRMFAVIGHPVHRLRRIGIAELYLAKLKVGCCRPLTDDEIIKLRRIAKRLT